MKRLFLFILIPITLVLIFSLMNAAGFLKSADYKIYDMLLHVKPPVTQDSRLLLVDVDDTAMKNVPVTWPWPRNYMADGLVLMKEMGAHYALFDIVYEQPSPPGINLSKYNGIAGTFNLEFGKLRTQVASLYNALASGSVNIKNAAPFFQTYIDELQSAERNLYFQTLEIAEDMDESLGKAGRLFGNTYFLVNILKEDTSGALSETAQQLDEHLRENLFLSNIKIDGNFPHKAQGIVPPFTAILAGAKGVGFPEVEIDPDGVTRRIDLVFEYKGTYIPQIAFSALLDLLGNPALEIKNNAIILKQAKHPAYSKPEDIVIPLTEDSRMLINWPPKTFLDSFRHISFWELIKHDKIEDDLIYNLSILVGLENEGKIKISKAFAWLLATYYDKAMSVKKSVQEGNDLSEMEKYKDLRREFFLKLEQYLSLEMEESIIKHVDAYDATERADIENTIHAVFKANRENLFPKLKETREKLSQTFEDSFCLMSWTSTSTTDIGVTPFAGEYVNVGTHAAVVNTILSGIFLDDSPWWVSSVLALIFSIGIFFLVYGRKNPVFSLISGISGLVAMIVCFAVFFILTGIYLNILSPLLCVFLTFVIFTIINFIQTAQEKTFIRNAFSHYLSTDVINELISDPSKLNLGGEKKQLTAIFTDIKGFSTLSELLAPDQLVKLLNEYLTEMSNIILDLRGTIDKYEGDAIISFFGAPIEYPTHAYNACLSAVRMKKMEQILNTHLINEKLSPSSLLTRIGINTGEMVVGNMGTAKKMDYTIMGNAVNLAARLEGVNKQYGTWICISEDTYEAAGKDFAVRKLDRVRVVGINKPVRIYELIDEKRITDKVVQEAIEIFHSALNLFEKREWDKARGAFKETRRLMANDMTSEIYIKRCITFKRKPPPDNWDGVFSITIK